MKLFDLLHLLVQINVVILLIKINAPVMSQFQVTVTTVMPDCWILTLKYILKFKTPDVVLFLCFYFESDVETCLIYVISSFLILLMDF